MHQRKPIEDAFVLIQDGRILQIGKREGALISKSIRRLELKNTMLMPGFINTHCHLEYGFLKNRVKYRGNFRNWLREIGECSRQATRATVHQSVQQGIQQSLLYGTTTICDTSSTGISYQLLKNSPLRSIVLFELLEIGEASSIGYWMKFQDKLKTIIHASSTNSNVQWGLSPHTPFTVSSDILKILEKFSIKHQNLLVSMHISESREEKNFFKMGTGSIQKRISKLNPQWRFPKSTTSIQYLNRLGWLPKLDLAVHVNTGNHQDFWLISKNRIAVVHCPGSHSYFKHPKFPYSRARKSGVLVCIGTDSLASNQSLSLFREMYLFQKCYPTVTGFDILAMVTSRAAQAIGKGNILGQIRPGFLADIIGIPVSSQNDAPDQLYNEVIQYSKAVSFSMIQGELQMRESLSSF